MLSGYFKTAGYVAFLRITLKVFFTCHFNEDGQTKYVKNFFKEKFPPLKSFMW